MEEEVGYWYVAVNDTYGLVLQPIYLSLSSFQLCRLLTLQFQLSPCKYTTYVT